MPETSKPFPKVEPEQVANQPTPEPETTTPETTKAPASSLPAEPDWSAIETGETVPGDDGQEMDLGPGDEAPGLLSKDDFYAMFEMAFQMPNAVLAGRGPFPLDCLPIKPEEQRQARAASDAIYDIANETAALRWLLQPESPWLQRAIPIVMFVGLKAAAVRSEIRAKRATEVEAQEVPEEGAGEGGFAT